MRLELKALREALTTRKALYNDNLRKNEERILKMKKDLQIFTPERIARLKAKGYDVAILTDIDYELLKTDAEYNKHCANSIEILCKSMYEDLCREANV